MALDELQQAQLILEKSTRVLLIIPPRASLDAFASMVALYLALLRKKPDQADAISPSHVPYNLQFLPGSSQVLMQPHTRTDIVLDIAGVNQIVNIHTETLSKGLRLHIMVPEGTKVTKDQLETLVRSLPYDAAIVIGAPDLEALGNIFTSHADFFYNTPIINIDRSADNEHYGTVNLVDLTAGSIAEITYELIAHLTPQPDQSIATALYAGIIAGTDSFQKPSTTPRSFKLAAQLLEQQADREAVIRYLVKTKPLALLKLLGRLYAHLKYQEHTRIFSSYLSEEDFKESGASLHHLPLAFKELTNNISNFSALYAVCQFQGQWTAYILLGKGLKKRIAELQVILSARRDNGLLSVTLPVTSLEEAEIFAAQKIKSVLM